MPRTHTGESSIARAVRVLEAFDTDQRSLSVSTIAARSRLHVATASRIVAELVAHGLLERGENREVRVGVRLWELGSRASATLSLREAAMPYLTDIHAIVDHHVQLGIADGEDVLFVERLTAKVAVVNYSRVAGRLPLYASSSGHVLLAFGPVEQRERLVGKTLSAFTDATITTADGLDRALELVRRQGYAHLPGHIHPDAAGLAVPVFDGLGTAIAAVSVIGPNDDRLGAHVHLLQAAARGIRRGLRPVTAG